MQLFTAYLGLFPSFSNLPTFLLAEPTRQNELLPINPVFQALRLLFADSYLGVGIAFQAHNEFAAKKVGEKRASSNSITLSAVAATNQWLGKRLIAGQHTDIEPMPQDITHAKPRSYSPQGRPYTPISPESDVALGRDLFHSRPKVISISSESAT